MKAILKYILKFLKHQLSKEAFARFDFASLQKLKAMPKRKSQRLFEAFCERLIHSQDISELTLVRPHLVYLPPSASRKFFCALNKLSRSGFLSPRHSPEPRVRFDESANKTKSFFKKRRVSHN